MITYIRDYIEVRVSGFLTQALKDSFLEDKYEGDLAFSCFSIGLDFDFTNNENVKNIRSLK